MEGIGRCTIEDGSAGVPTVSLCGAPQALACCRYRAMPIMIKRMGRSALNNAAPELLLLACAVAMTFLLALLGAEPPCNEKIKTCS